MPALRRFATAPRQAPAPLPAGAGRAEHQAVALATSALVGKRPCCFLEKRSLPSTVISNTPLLPFRKSTLADGVFERMMSRAARARGS